MNQGQTVFPQITDFRHKKKSSMHQCAARICDSFQQTVVPTGFYTRKDYPDKLRRIKYYDAEKGRTFIFHTNQFTLPASTIAELYRYRWRVEIFFKWIKQHL